MNKTFQFIENTNYINELSDQRVKEILRALFIKNCTFNADIQNKDLYDEENWQHDEDSRAFYKSMSETQYFQRLKTYNKESDTVWEGITWILDLLPNFPNEALKGLNTYFLANCQFLPDSYFTAFSEWSAIIRAKYINVEIPQDFFLNLQAKEFEYLNAELFERLGYKIKLTKSSYDGGIDIIAEKVKTGKKEKLLIQCKRHKKKVGIDEIRKLLGVVSSNKATKGILVACTTFTSEAKKFSNVNPRIELINISDLTKLLNQYLGANWNIKTDRYIIKYKRQNENKYNGNKF